MTPEYPANDPPFTIVRSAAEEARIKAGEERWENEGGRLLWSAGQVMHVPDAKLPYTVLLTRPRGHALQQSFATMREAEAFIRRSTPVPAPALSKLYDRPASEI